jgi:hypothetical protein
LLSNSHPAALYRYCTAT